MRDRLIEVGGYRVFTTDAIRKQIPRRTHKKKRIQKKWIKRYGYKDVPDSDRAIIVGDCLYVTPTMFRRIYERMQREVMYCER